MSTLIVVSINYNPITGTVLYCYDKKLIPHNIFISLLNEDTLYWIDSGFATKDILLTIVKKCEKRRMVFKRKEKIKKKLHQFLFNDV